MDERVQGGDECPECGENRIDWLVWLDDETVECQACETQYAVFPADWNDVMVAPDGTIAPGYWQDHSANMGVGN